MTRLGVLMRRALVCCMVGLLLPLLGTTSASATSTTSGTTTFAVEEGLGPVQPGYTAHISGVGLNGPWRGWHFAADIEQTSDCDAGGCPIVQFSWELYDTTPATSKVWGACTGSPNCTGATSTSLSGRVDIPLIVNGGIPWVQGAGGVTGYLPPGSPYGIATGSLTLTLDLQ